MKYNLTDTATRNAKPKPDGNPSKLTDGGGLYLLVRTTGKYWRYDYTHNNKRKTLAIGIYPDITLKQARDLHQQARSLLAQGVDPSTHKQAAKAANIAKTEHTFEAIAREWHKQECVGWTPQHATQIQTRLEKDVFPYLGRSPIADIAPPDILKCLRRVEERGAVDTAKRIKTDISCVFRYAEATGRATRDPTPALKDALKPTKVKNHAAITNPKKIGELLRAIDNYHGNATTIAALQLCSYLFQRPGEVRKMTWVEIDTENALWTIPADKMKQREEHLVPLSRQALAILAELKPLTGKFAYVFPAVGNPYKPLNKNTLPKAIHLMGFDSNTMTAHGFRATASTMLHELGYPSEVIEKQLSHTVGNDVSRVYNKAQYIEQRTTMMQEWADYLDSLRDSV